MSVVAKTRPIRRAFHFKPGTPRRVLMEVQTRYSDYLDNGDDEQVDVTTSDWYKEISAKMKPKDYLRHLREAHSLTQRELGEQLGTNSAHVSDWENGQREISKNVARKLAEIFKVNTGVFI